MVCLAGGIVLGIGLIVAVQPAHGKMTRAVTLKSLVTDNQFILTVKVQTLDPARPGMVLVVDEDLKEKTPFRRLPVNLTGDIEARKENQTPQLLKRLAPDLPLVLFVNPRGNSYIVFAYTNGTWFQMHAQKTGDDNPVWGFTHCEPYLRRTFKGTTAELKQIIADSLAGKKEPPDHNPKEEPGLGPEVQAEDKPTEKPPQSKIDTGVPINGCTQGPVFAVIPTVTVVPVVALLAWLFPALFGGLAVGMRRWMVMFTVLSLNSTLYFAHGWFARYIKDTWLDNALALWLTMTFITVAGILWAWRRHTLAVQASPLDTTLLGRGEAIILTIWSLLGLGVVGYCQYSKASLLDQAWKPYLVVSIGFWAATVHVFFLRLVARYRSGTRAGISTEGIVLLAMLVAAVGLGAGLPRGTSGTGKVEKGDEDLASSGALRLVKRTEAISTFEATDRGMLASSPLVDGNRLYVAGAHQAGADTFGHLYCLARNKDDRTGKEGWKEVWRFNDGDGMKQVYSSPCLANGKLYIGEGFHQDKHCKLYCIEADTGEKLWEKQTSSHTESSPCVVDGKVFFGAGDDGLYCLDANEGKEVWHFDGLHVDLNPLVVDGRVYAGSGIGDTYTETAIFCLDAKTGEELWRQPADLPVWGSPVVMGDKVYYGLGNGNILQQADKPAGALLCLKKSNGQEVWRYNVADAVFDRPALDERHVYFCSRDGRCYCVTAQKASCAGATILAARL